MLLIDGKQIDWAKVGNEENAIRKFTRPHTWTIATHKIKYDYANSRIQCPDIGVLTKYSSRFCYPYNAPKATHTVEYTTGTQPHPTKQGVMLNLPPLIMIYGGYEKDVIDNEINFFHTFAPWLENGIAYEKKRGRKINLYQEERVHAKAESEATIKVNLLTKILQLKEKDVLAMARTIASLPGKKSGIFIDESILEGENMQLRNSHITNLKNGIFRYADANPHQLRNLLNSKQADIFDLYERGRELDLVRLKTDGLVLPVVGVWNLVEREVKQGVTTSEKEIEICSVNDNELAVDAFARHMAKPKSEALLENLRALVAIEVKRREVAITT